jgi:hypothetical protein
LTGRGLRLIARELLVAGFFLALALFASRPLASHLTTRTLAGLDPLVDLWTVNWLARHFFEPSAIFQGNMFAPERFAVLHSDLSLGTVVFLVPLAPFVADPVPLYNVAVLVALAFGGWAFHLYARALTGSLWAGLFAGVVVAFSAQQLRHLYHLNLLTIGWLALFLLGLHRLLERPSWAWAVFTGVAYALNAQSSGYYAVIGAVIALVIGAVRFRALARPVALKRVAAAALTAAVLTAPYFLSYMQARAEQNLRRPIGMSERMSFRPSRDLAHDGYLYRHVVEGRGEALFPGLLTLALAGVAVARRSPGWGALAVVAAVLIVIGFGPYAAAGERRIPLPYLLLYNIPPFDSMRHPFTFAKVGFFLVSVLAAAGYASLALARRSWAGPLLVALAILETAAPPARLQEPPPGVPPAYDYIRTLPPAPVLEVPLYAPETLLWAARHGLPVVNGQGSAFVPLEMRLHAQAIENWWITQTPESVDETRPTERLLAHYERLYVIVPSRRKPELAPLADAFDRSRLYRRLAVMPDGDRVYLLEGEPRR